MNRSIKRFCFTTLALAVLALGLSALSNPVTLAVTDDAKAIYAKKCASCHGPDGSGGTPIGKQMKLRDLRSAEVQKQTDAQLTTLIGKGKGKMPGYQNDLGAAGVKQMVAYMRQLAKK
jgi:cytochrome c6